MAQGSMFNCPAGNPNQVRRAWCSAANRWSQFTHKPKVIVNINLKCPSNCCVLFSITGKGGDMGVRHCRYPTYPGIRIHGNCDAATLLPIIQAHVLSGSIVHSDQWAAYNRVSSIPGIAAHHTVNYRICRFHNWCPYTEHRILLEQGKDQVQMNERGSPPPTSILFR